MIAKARRGRRADENSHARARAAIRLVDAGERTDDLERCADLERARRQRSHRHDALHEARVVLDLREECVDLRGTPADVDGPLDRKSHRTEG